MPDQRGGRVSVGIKRIHPSADLNVRGNAGRKRGRSLGRSDQALNHPQPRRIRLTEHLGQGVEMALADGSFRQSSFIPGISNRQWTETFHIGTPQQNRDWRNQSRYPPRWQTQQHTDHKANQGGLWRKQMYHIHPQGGPKFLPQVANKEFQDSRITQFEEQGVEVELRNEIDASYVESGQELMNSQHPLKCNRRKMCLIGIPLVILLVTGLASILMITVFEVDRSHLFESGNSTNITQYDIDASKSTLMPSEYRTFAPTKSPSNHPTRVLTREEEISLHISIELEEKNITESTSAQKQAIDWIINIDSERIEHDERGFMDKFAIVTLFYAFNGNNWKSNKSWLSDPNICAWFGIECDFRGTLKQINLEHNKLKGSIPPEITFLSDLTRLQFGGNKIKGVIPKQIGSMSNLESLCLQANALTGVIPRNVYELTGLSELNLAANKLNGGVRIEIEKMIELKSLNLASNSFSSSIPSQMGSLQSLEKLLLNNNSFSGSIPRALKNLQKLSVLALKNNKLTGSIHDDLGYIQSLKKLHVQNNRLTGSIPNPIFLNMTLLEDLRLHSNLLSGSIHSAISNLQNLAMLSAHKNLISGSLPEEIGNLVNLKRLYLNDNIIKGTLTDELGNLKKLATLDLSENKLTGTIPISIGQMSSLEILSLWKNELTGEIPANLTSLDHMTHFYLDRNDLHGSVPEEICEQEGEISIHVDCAGYWAKVKCRNGCCDKCY